MVTQGGSGVTLYPAWLPELLQVDPWTGHTFEILYEIFTRDFKISRPHFQGYEVWFFPEMDEGKEKIFWHLTHQDDEEAGVRLPDPRRSERLPWVRCLIENPERQEVIWWDYREASGDIHTYIWLKEYDFVVVMKKYRDGKRRLISAFHISYSHTRRSLEKKYNRRIK